MKTLLEKLDGRGNQAWSAAEVAKLIHKNEFTIEGVPNVLSPTVQHLEDDLINKIKKGIKGL